MNTYLIIGIICFLGAGLVLFAVITATSGNEDESGFYNDKDEDPRN